ncbi:hypothetical protein [Hydrogenoanaerobacterium sp.]|nr:hypothetical protein [Hydrogenoanaerobacterium sp.]
MDDGELYLSFWDSSDRFFIKPEDELKNSQSSGFGMTMSRTTSNRPAACR